MAGYAADGMEEFVSVGGSDGIGSLLLEGLPFVKRNEVVGDFVRDLLPFAGTQRRKDIGHGGAGFDFVRSGDVPLEIVGVDSSTDGTQARGFP